MAPRRVRRPPDRAEAARRRAWLPVAAALVVVWPAALAGAAAAGRLLPGTRMDGRSLAFLDQEAAIARLREGLEAPVAVEGLDLAAPLAVTREAIGLTLDEAASLETARAWSASRPGRLAALALGWRGVDLDVRYQLDDGAARAWLAALKPQVDRDPIIPHIDPAGGRPTLRDGRDGLRLDVDASLDRLRAALPHAPTRFEPFVERFGPAGVDAAAGLAGVSARLTAPLDLEAYDPVGDETLRWVLPSATWMPAVQRVEWDGQAWRWRLKSEAMAELLTDLPLGDRLLEPAEVADVLARRLDGDASAYARLRHPRRQVTVRPGDSVAAIGREAGIPFPWILAANPGLGHQLRPGQTITLPSPDELLPLPPLRDRRIRVSLGKQRMQAWQDGALRWDWPVSTGIESSPTATGTFQVQDRQEEAFATAWDLWMPQFLAIYQPDPRVQVFNGFHGLPRHKDGRLVWAELIGQPASYGCVVLGAEHARLLFDWALPGTVVEIRD